MAANTRPFDPADETAAWETSARVRAYYEEYSDALVRQLTRRTGCREVARELAQETFVRLLRMDEAMLARIEQPEAYVRRIATNLLRDWSRATSLRDRFAEEGQPSAPPLDQVALLESRDTLRRLEEAVSKLKPRTREIFLAHRIEGLSYAQIAARTGLSLKGVEKQMSKAIAKIDRFLDRS